MQARTIRQEGIAGPAAEIAMSKDKNGSVSKPALNLARRIDQLQPGAYTIELSKTKWPVGIIYKIQPEPDPRPRTNAEAAED